MNTDKLKKAMALAWNKKEYEIYGILKEIMDEGGFEAISPCPPNMKFVKNYGYYFIDNNDGPYCMSCFERKGKLIHVKVENQFDYSENKPRTYIQCPNCKEYRYIYSDGTVR